MSLFDYSVLFIVIAIITCWLLRHFRQTFVSQCETTQCANCRGCSKGQQPD